VGYRGPAPKPTVLKRQEGNPGRRPLNDREPQPAKVTPTMPEHLDEDARREWRRLVRILRRMRVLTEADGIALGTLCQAQSTLAKAQIQITRTGLVVKTPNGFVQQNPLLKVVNQQSEIVIRHFREFGLTPASRSRLTAEEAVPSDAALFKLLSQPRPPRRLVPSLEDSDAAPPNVN